jgi:hypothetical protein
MTPVNSDNKQPPHNHYFIACLSFTREEEEEE